MRARLLIRRILFVRPLRPRNAPRPRTFTQNTLLQRSRPQLPFLSSPAARRRTVARYLTTETKQWIKSELRTAVKYTLILWTFTGLGLVMAFGVQQEWLERKYPTPPEWSWYTRKDFRDARMAESYGDDGDDVEIDWALVGSISRRLLLRLETPTVDGAGLAQQTDGGILVEGVGKTGFDITQKSEPWQRGYYEALMGAARAAEHLDNCVTDKTRLIVFPKHFMIGPSNPNPRPVPPGSAPAPREEDCRPACDPPETFYMRIVTTKGFTEKQKLDAALGYAAWLDFKATPQAALEMYKWALDITTTDAPKDIANKSTGILNTSAGIPSANVLSATTALAIHHAANANLNSALPIFLSILRARKSLPNPPQRLRSAPNPKEDENTIMKAIIQFLKSAFVAPSYPPPPNDGTSPPNRNSKERCEEAAVMTYIGEILYASRTSKTNKDDGLAWTREAVDIAEEELRGKAVDKEANKTCKQCLRVGLTNWGNMVTKLAKDEKAKKATVSSRSSWLGFGEDQHKEVVGRWESEEQVVKDRMLRAREILDPTFSQGGSGGFDII